MPRPHPGPLDVLVRVSACGICLSDVHLLDGSIPPVIDVVTPGHEACGIVEEAGELVEGWQAGDRVVMMGGRNCGRCKNCRSGRLESCLQPELMGFHYDGAWADHVVVPYYALSRAPAGVPDEQAAILADAVATPYGAIKSSARLEPGEAIGLWGIGGLGTHAVQIARMLGAGLVIAVDPLASARERALRVGADAAIDPTTEDVNETVRELTDGDGLDVAVDLVGANAVVLEAMKCLGRGGRTIMVGLSMEPITLGPQLVMGVQSQALLGHLGYSKSDLDDLVKLAETRRLDLAGSVSDVIPLEEVATGVDRLARKDDDPVRIIVTP